MSCKGETRLVTVSGNFRPNNSEAVRDAAVRGVGLALLPTFAMWQDLKSGALVRVLPDWTPYGTFGNSLTAYYIADRQLAPRSGHWSTSWPNFRALSRLGPRSRAGFCPKIALKAARLP
jgi:DNA-binding transcriptional LysR family regulator